MFVKGIISETVPSGVSSPPNPVGGCLQDSAKASEHEVSCTPPSPSPSSAEVQKFINIERKNDHQKCLVCVNFS